MMWLNLEQLEVTLRKLRWVQETHGQQCTLQKVTWRFWHAESACKGRAANSRWLTENALTGIKPFNHTISV
jgi:hypothetical protein